MKNYDFNILSPFEFECFSRDLLIKREGLEFKNFADGRDGGIDLRYCSPTKGKIIVQAKRYKDYTSLFSTLKKEVEKVKKLNPDRYIIVTSVDLTAKNCDEIKTLFEPYIKSESDIIGKQDLNRLLSEYSDVELRYFKLWLASSDVLQAFLNKKVVNQSKFQLEIINECVRTYVMNQSFNDALKIVGKNRYVIISGVPGIGKTTLARMLVFYFLTKGGYDKFYYVPSNIDDAYNVFDKDSKQVFFFDDFLGNTRFVATEKNFDAKFIDFVHAVQRNSNKLLIVTTREYILKDALNYYSKLDKDSIEMAKCVVDMHDYSKYIKAQILYNHLVDSEINPDYLIEIKRNKNYKKLIYHDNFNPRIVEVLVKYAKNNSFPPEKFIEIVNGFFDNPKSVWEDAFFHLSSEAREMLEVLASLNPPIMYDQWKAAYEHFYVNTRQQKYLDEVVWENNVKMLSDCFIVIDNSGIGHSVDYHNPGIKDFIISHLERNRDKVLVIIRNACFIEQVYSLFYDDENSHGDIFINEGEYSIVLSAFTQCWDNFRSCGWLIKNTDGIITLVAKERSKQEVLYEFQRSFKKMCKSIPGIIEDKFHGDFIYDKSYLRYSMYVLEHCNFGLLKIDPDEYFEFIKSNVSNTSEYMEFIELMDTVYASKSSYKNDQELFDKLDVVFLSEIEQCNNDGCELRECMDIIKEQIPAWDCSTVDMELSEIEAEFESYIESNAIEGFEWEAGDYKYATEEQQIDNLFDTLV